MPVRVFSACLNGMNALSVQVEVDIARGLPVCMIVGLGDSAVQESRERVRAAIKNSGAEYPLNRKIINLAPAHIKKHGPAFDLAIAVSILGASKQIPITTFEDSLFLGELALDGSIRKFTGMLLMMMHAKKERFKNIYLPYENFLEAQRIKGLSIHPVKTLKELIHHLRTGTKMGTETSMATRPSHVGANKKQLHENFSYIKGQPLGKRAIEIAGAGRHHLIFTGPPGVGKTLLANTLQLFLPELSEQESLEVTGIYSVRGMLDEQNPLMVCPPFREVHQTITRIALLGGGSDLLPGEISLAHHGVLLLDEINEFPRSLLETLRQPLEEKRIAIHRAKGHMTFPANFLLVGTMNPCPCGSQDQCLCNNVLLNQYKNRLSKPFLDRIDLFAALDKVETKKLFDPPEPEEDLNTMVKKIKTAREIQRQRYKKTSCTLNGDLDAANMHLIGPLKPGVKKRVEQTAEENDLSARSCHRLLKVARTIADLEGSEVIQENHLLEATHFKIRNAR